MKKTIFFLALIIVSCGDKKEKNTTNEVVSVSNVSLEKGKSLFEENNCTACHKIDQKVVGPSLQEMAKIYKEQQGNIIAFLKEEALPIVDPAMYESMKINLQITKSMSNEELKSLELYIQSYSK